jgi:hypothetical protein
MLYACLLKYETSPTPSGPFWINSSPNRQGEKMVVDALGVADVNRGESQVCN